MKQRTMLQEIRAIRRRSFVFHLVWGASVAAMLWDLVACNFPRCHSLPWHAWVLVVLAGVVTTIGLELRWRYLI